MRLGSLLLVLTSCFVGKALGQQVEEEVAPLENFKLEDKSIESEQTVEEGPQTINFDIQWEILNSDEDGLTAPMEFYNKDRALLSYNFTNFEDFNVSIIGVSGSIIDARTRQQVANITAASIEKVFAPINESVSFNQELEFNLPEGLFYILPGIHVEDQTGDEKVVSVQPKIVRIEPELISIFNIQFLTAFVTFLAMIYGGYYFLVVKAEPSVDKRQLKEKSRNIKVDQSWLPQEYKK
ncbi:uncharacterized protein SCODWIG_02761 [Saccharomycodes ludwigii]|uniref:Increased recombination centers protein 22 n=1 Tax=Saccharomycodes ludwigii TaxID=36035 RepID=A0A376BA49_9ASCO|nr:hypothetical protein SCDLUD_005163 [Saccharomycodes ludwigii]KAH3898825.1 hypothetical protein SCDLUD_005163 [Saccharomycodes ludwigii]SSD61000.1 uncharacterized protein SCODWIG_02761 [Saccharomycodes ludwigii]